MKFCKVEMVVVLMVAMMALTGCRGGGAKVETVQSSYSTTLGKELQDLDEAYKKKLLTEDQYKDAKAKLIEQRTKTKEK